LTKVAKLIGKIHVDALNKGLAGKIAIVSKTDFSYEEEASLIYAKLGKGKKRLLRRPNQQQTKITNF
jgi:hypothetical protein